MKNTNRQGKYNVSFENDYLMLRSLAVDGWVAFTIDGPGSGSWELTIASHACNRGAEKINVYLLPGDTTDIASALTQDNLVGVYGCYDKDNTLAQPSVANNNMNVQTTKLEKTWTAGDDETHILVLQVAETSTKYSYMNCSPPFKNNIAYFRGNRKKYG